MLHVFPSTDQIELTRLQKPSRSPGTIISSPDPKSDKQLWRYWSLYKKMSKNSIFSALVLIFTTRGHLIQKLCAPLKLAHQYASFATLQSQIWWTIMEILESKYKNIKKNSQIICLVPIFTTTGAPDLKVNGTTAKTRSSTVQKNWNYPFKVNIDQATAICFQNFVFS